MVSQISEAMLDVIADALVDKGYILLSDIIPDYVSLALLEKMQAEQNIEFKKAAIGRGIEQQINTEVRCDKISWLDNQDHIDREYILVMNQLKDGLNRRLFMGLFDFESHYAVYEPGAFYKKHLDSLHGSQNRILSTVFFLNPDWQENDGGELILYDESDLPLEVVNPNIGTLVLFLSERFPHEVRPTMKTRNSIAGWFRVSNANHGF
ncbi:MAG: 2OG-Fe(II) oxygenase [Shewanella psychromarinicola]|jgi:SM-20-related protein|uniref:2OG-Fe(II) oxygenase n=1 Tax=Shewanella psychromarinicola TaxID=2487742 RepID=A0A3N4EC43_9GAMM|nr:MULTISPECIES: 2OG-Fe(II) oxygenase [Shewanella]AZG36629.1 2OG-Fe(II) oxygenase [Shewanella psychromarinicola]PKG77855.1 proline hydroxylase [Shewanella sp. Actino-trap-3]RPA34477.1 2OG-Fe(II) oxygenase [Shewanella psychromarinicola]|tara:strand:+ start:8251 stop:8874 length:624 start_codon:yes stop_codon:yes gene_type:complete